jgi:hypothetical protein
MKDVSVLELYSKMRDNAEKKAAADPSFRREAAVAQPPKAKIDFSKAGINDKDTVARKMFIEAKNTVDKMLGAGVDVIEDEFMVFSSEEIKKGDVRVREAKASYKVDIKTPAGGIKKAQVVVSYDAAKPEPVKVEQLFYDENENERPLTSLELNKYAQETTRSPNNSTLVFYNVEGPEKSDPHAPAPVKGYDEVPAADLPAAIAALRAKGFKVEQKYIGREHGPKFGRHCYEIQTEPSRYAEMKSVVASINEKAQKRYSVDEWVNRSLEQGKGPKNKYKDLPWESRSMEKADAFKDFDKKDWQDRSLDKGGDSVANKAYGNKDKWFRYDQKRQSLPEWITALREKGLSPKQIREFRHAWKTAIFSGKDETFAERAAVATLPKADPSAGKSRLDALKMKAQTSDRAENPTEEQRKKEVRKPGSYNQGEVYEIRKRDRESISPEDYKGEKVDADAVPKGVETLKDGFHFGEVYEIRDRKKTEISPEDYKGEKIDSDAIPKGVDTHGGDYQFGEIFELRDKGRDKPVEISPETTKAARLARLKERVAKLKEKASVASK